MRFTRSLAMGIFLIGSFASRPAAQDPVVTGPLRGAMGRDYWLQKPAAFDASRPHWLVVLVHGFRGIGRDVLWLRRALARFDDFITVAPSFPEGFQLLEANTDRQLLALFAALKKTYRLHDKLFLCGFSAGAQFSHRFTMQHPEFVIGCAAHSGGTWGPMANPAARHIPMALSCGLDDTVRSSIGQTMSRVQAAHRYFDLLAGEGFHIKARLWRGVGHATSAATEALIAECYVLATRGLDLRQLDAFERRVATIRRAIVEGATAATRRDIAALQPALFREPRKKSLRRSVLNGELRRIHAVVWRGESLGGRSADGRRYWIDDRNENAAGWTVNEPAAAARRERLRAFLSAVRRWLETGG